MKSGLKETKTIDGEEHYQLEITGQWVPAHPVPELHRGMVFFTTMYPSPVFVVEGNDPEELERHSTHLPGGIPERKEVGEYWLLYIPSSGSEPLRWHRGEYIRRQFQAGQYKLEPTEMAKKRGIDSEAWWQAVVQQKMTDYDFIDPDRPEQSGEPTDEGPDGTIDVAHPTGEKNDVETDKVGGENNTEDNRGFLGRAYNQLKNVL